MVFANVEYLFLWLLLIPYIVWYVMKWRNTGASLRIPDGQVYLHTPKSYKNYLIHLPFVLRVVALALIVVVLARPQTTDSWRNSEVEGIDIMLAVDISGTMQAEDLKPNRIEAAKAAAAEFVNGRPNDNIGLVIFAGQSYTLCPLTSDHAALLNLMKDVRYGMVQDGTAIGVALAYATSRLKESQAKSKVVILLTDGINNRGEISPLTAAEIAKQFDIRIYTIGVGSRGDAPYPIQTYGGQVQYVNLPAEIDEEVLGEIARTTGGSYFRATNNSALKEVYKEIDKLEKTKLHVKEFSKRDEEYRVFAWWALVCVLAELLLRCTILRRIP